MFLVSYHFKVSLAVWDQALSFMNKYNSTWQFYFAFTSVFFSTKKLKFYELSILPQKPLFAWERLQFCRVIFPLAHLHSSLSSEHRPQRYVSCIILNIFLSLKNAVSNVFCVFLYTYNVFLCIIDSNFFEWIMWFSMLESVIFCTLCFLRGGRSKSWSIIRATDQQSILSSCEVSTGVEWVPGWSS